MAESRDLAENGIQRGKTYLTPNHDTIWSIISTELSHGRTRTKFASCSTIITSDAAMAESRISLLDIGKTT